MRSVPQPTSTCFAIGRDFDTLPKVVEIRLDACYAEALAEVLPILICGEESASLVFAQLSRLPGLAAAHAELTGIERDESEHACLLSQLRFALPEIPPDKLLIRTARLFFRRMHEQDVGRHFARIAALDSAVCILFGALRRHAPISAEPVLQPMFARLHRDEARHVLIARKYALALIGSQTAYAIAVDTRQRLVELLTLRAAALEQLLHVDADKLFARLRTPPRGLFA